GLPTIVRIDRKALLQKALRRNRQILHEKDDYPEMRLASLRIAAIVFLRLLNVEVRRRVPCIAGPDFFPVTVENCPTFCDGHPGLRKHGAMAVDGS
ncbi:hypothetical protein, partial [Burkholderia vietnamiensis]